MVELVPFSTVSEYIFQIPFQADRRKDLKPFASSNLVMNEAKPLFRNKTCFPFF
jgi:hypothetical protein